MGEVLAATLLLEGRLVIEVRRSGRDTLAAELVALLADVDRARQEGRTRAQDLIERLAPPTVLATGLATVAYGPLGGLAILWTGIGYPLRLAGPTAVMSHVRQASKRGILIRDGRTLDLLARVDVVVFDKTGTLTESVPRLSRVRSVAPHQPLVLLRLVAAIEARQSHPIANAIRDAARALGLPEDHVESLSVLPGLGLCGQIGGVEVLVGSERLMRTREVALPAGWLAAQADDDDMYIHVALDNLFAGSIGLAPRIRDEALGVVEILRARGIQVITLSGDRERPTRRLADALGLDGYRAELMPQDKAERIRAMQAGGRRVCFVGDGINDVLALRTADVSISLRGAATIAESAASILLLDSGLSALPALFDLSARTRANLDRSAGITVVCGATGAAGVFAHVFAMPQVASLYVVALAGSMVNALTPNAAGLVEDPESADATSAREIAVPDLVMIGSAPVMTPRVERHADPTHAASTPDAPSSPERSVARDRIQPPRVTADG